MFSGDTLVLFKHWCDSSQQVPAFKLWLQVPHLPHNVPHVSLCCFQLYLHCVLQGGASADDQIKVPVHEDCNFEPCLLCLCGGWQHLPQVPRRVLQPGGWGNHALFHCCLCLFGYP